MRYTFLFIMTLVSAKLFAQTSTNSTGSGNFNNAATWTSPKDLTGTANILDGHTITIQDKTSTSGRHGRRRRTNATSTPCSTTPMTA